MSEDTVFEFESSRTRVEIAAYLRALAGEFDGDGPVTFRDGEYVARVTPPETATFDVEVEREHGDDGSELQIELEIEWEEGEETSAERLEEPPEPEVGIEFAAESDDRPEPSQGHFEVYEDRAGQWRWRLVHRNGNIIADGGEGYASKRNAIRGLRGVQHNAPGAGIEELD
ncbi:HVO_2922 family protein [Halalkalicoccus ordinarius]|uniref:HVO_2922 family protein n=1 Tax=Halalkalicoccus ordinarius TaxID=3116651 RepID=UPI00300F11CE